MKRFFLIVMVLLLIGCQKDEVKVEEKNGFPVIITENFTGQNIEVKYEKPVKRAISMSQATTEMMLALGLEDKMIGTAFLEEEIYPQVKEKYEKIEVLSKRWPSYEQILVKQPDFITGWGVAFTKRGVEADKLLKNDIKIFIPKSMKDIDADINTCFEDMLTFGKLFGEEEKAKEFVEKQRLKLENIKKNIDISQKRRVFIFDISDNTPFTTFEGYTTNILKLIGLENVMSGKGVDKTWGATSFENVVKENPDYIIVVEYEGNRNNSDFLEKIRILKENKALKDVLAIKNNRILKVKLSEITPGIRSVDTLERILKEIENLD